MKLNRTKLFTASAAMLALVIALSIFVSGSRAQQMGDMPYDLHFIDMMIMHHQEGIEMAQMAETKAQSAKVKAFATKTAADQQKDIDDLQAHRNHWYAGKPPMDHASMQSMMQSMHPGMNMDMEDTRRKLMAANGAAFDRLFLDTMIHHHQMAVDMAKDATTKAEHAEIKENGWDLNIGRYVRGAAADVIDVDTALADLATAQKALRDAESRLAERLKAAGYA